MVKNLIWSMYFTTLELQHRTVNTMICFEENTEQIKFWSFGFNKITSQNLLRKITESIDKEIFKDPAVQVFIYLEEKRYGNSKPYEKFILNYSASVSVNFKKMPTKPGGLLEGFKLEGQTQTLLEVLNSVPTSISARSLGSIIHKYIKNWNEVKSKNASIGYVSKKIQPKIENQKLILKVKNVQKRHAELVNSTPFDLTFQDKNKLLEVETQINELLNIVKTNNTGLAKLVEQSTHELTTTIKTVEKRVQEVSKDVKSLLPNKKIKHIPSSLRDPINAKIFKILLFNAGSNALYQKKIRKSQLRITYTLLYHLGLRLNEIRTLEIQDILQGIERQELRITLFKTNRSHNATLSSCAVEDLKKLNVEFNFIQEECKYKYLFGKNYPIHSKTLLRIVNEDLANSCKLCGIRENIKSHSFRVSVISKLLQVTTVQNVASIVGHRDIRSTMCYDRYRLSKVAIQEIYSEAETEVDSKINK